MSKKEKEWKKALMEAVTHPGTVGPGGRPWAPQF